MGDRSLLLLSLFLFVGLAGVVMQVRGALLLNIQDTFPVSKSILGLVAPASAIGFIVSVLTIGMMTGRIDIKKFLLMGAGVSSLSLLLVSSSPFFFLLLVFFVIGGVSGGFVTALGTPILSHMYSERRGWIFHRYGMVWAIGAASGPLFASLILGFGSWRLAFFILGLCYVPIFLLFWKTRLPSSTKHEQPLSLKGLRSLGKHPVVFGMVLAIVVSTGVEGGFFIWLVYYMSQFFSQDLARLILAGYLMAYIPGRFFYSYLCEKTGYANLVFFNSVIISFLLFLAFFLTSGFLMVACVFAIGFIISGNFPTLLALGTDAFPEHSGPINGIARSSAALGLSAFPVLVGVIADWSSLANGMQFLIFPMIAASVITFVIRRKNLG